MEQYNQSYCLQMRERQSEHIVAAAVANLKEVHFGGKTMKLSFSRLARADPDQRRQGLSLMLRSEGRKIWLTKEIDFTQGYTLLTNIPSLTLQRTYTGKERKEIALLDIFVVPTQSNIMAPSFRELSSIEMEQFCMIGLAN